MPLTRIDVLDHGYVQLVDLWGRLDITDMPGDEAIVAAARMSTGKGFDGWGRRCSRCHTSEEMMINHQQNAQTSPELFNRCEDGEEHVWAPGDGKLLAYLYANAHHTPFEMAGMTIEVAAPIFVFREWHRHRVPFSYNEASSRYAPLPDVNYIPTLDRLMMNVGGSNKQAGTVKDADTLGVDKAKWFQEAIAAHYMVAEAIYQEALLGGVPKELARVHLPVGRYSKMRASANLRGWLNFMTLRSAPNAQYEIRVYSNAVHDLLRQHFGRTIALFDEKRTK